VDRTGAPGPAAAAAGADAAAVVRALFAAFARRDVAAALALVDPAAFELRVPTAGLARDGEPYRGAEGLRRYLADVERVWDQLDVELDELHRRGPAGPGGERVLALGRVRAFGAGRALDAPAGWVCRVRAGRVVAVEVFETRSAASVAADDDEPR
jgi:ketosteroid isomerase-like protein